MATAVFGGTPHVVELQLAEVFFETGEIRFRYSRYRTPTREWVRHGLFLAYHPNGLVASMGQYSDGFETGQWTEFHPNGERSAEGYYELGQEVGRWRFWSEDGFLEQSGPLRKGVEEQSSSASL